jgi:tetratricopeptide (TPR) repeat protein
MPSGNEVAKAIAGLFHRYAIHGIERRIRRLESGEVSLAQDRTEFVFKSRFLIRRSQDPRFAANVDAEAAESAIEKKHRALVWPTIIRSLLSGEPVPLDALLETPKTKGEKPYTRKQIQNLRSGKYASLFREVEAVAAEDRRALKMLTVASPKPLPAVAETQLAVIEHMADADRHSLDEDDHDAGRWARITDGRRAKRFADFRRVLDRGMTNPSLRDDAGFEEAVAYLRSNTMAAEILFNHLESIFVAEWFLAKSPANRETVLQAPQPNSLSQEILADAVRAMLSVFPDPRAVEQGLFLANKGWFDLGFPEEAHVVASYLLAHGEHDDRLRLLLRENQASHLLHMGLHEEALRAYKEVEARFLELGDATQALIARKNQAEALHLQGDTEQASEVFASIKKNAEGLPRSERYRIAVNLASAHSKLGLTRKAFEFVGEALDLADSADEVLGAGKLHHFVDALPAGVSIGPRAWRRLAKVTMSPGRRISGREILAMERRTWELAATFNVTGDASGERGRDDTKPHPEPGAEEAEER